MAKQASKSNAPSSFEEARAELESLVLQLEKGDQALETSLQAYQRGVTLLRYCQEKLDAAEASLQILDGDSLVPLSAPSVLDQED